MGINDDVFVTCGIIFRNYNFVVSQLKHLTPKTTSLLIYKIWSTIFFTLKIDGDIKKFVQIPVY